MREFLNMKDVIMIINDDKLEDAITSIMEDIDVVIQNSELEACHRIGKSDKKTSNKKTTESTERKFN